MIIELTDAPPELARLAALLLVLCDAGLLGPKPGPLSDPVPLHLRCERCHSPRTRMKSVGFYPSGLEPIRGFLARCRVCGGEQIFEFQESATREAA